MPSFLRRKALASVFCCTVILSTQYVFHIHGAWRTPIGQKRSLFSGAEDDIVDVSSSVEKVEQAATKGTDYRRIAIVQYTDNLKNELPGFALARDAMRAYAKNHSYAYYLFQEEDVVLEESELRALRGFTAHHAWRRPFMLSQFIREGKHEWIAYFDTDVIITSPSIPLEHFIDGKPTDSTFDMIIADDPSGINNGIFFQKATNWSLAFNDIWWKERPSTTKNMHDNWPFMAALLVAWAFSSQQSYEGDCSMSTNVAMEDWKNFYPCYIKHVGRLGSRTSHPEGCTPDFPEPCGSAVADDPHIKAVWGLNSGVGFGGKNAWDEASFTLHLAGRSREDRDKILRQHAQLVLSSYKKSSLTETFTESITTDVSKEDPYVLPDEQENANELILHSLTVRSDKGDLIVRRPISFSAPEELWQPVVSYKTHGFAAVIPGNMSTYTFEDEEAYLKSYRYVHSFHHSCLVF